MPSFGWTAPAVQVNPLYTLADMQQQTAVAQGAMQDQIDRRTLRGLSGGLANSDPEAMAQAAVLPKAGGTNAITALEGAQTGAVDRQQKGLAFASAMAGALYNLDPAVQEETYKAWLPAMRAGGMKNAPDQFPGSSALKALWSAGAGASKELEIAAGVPNRNVYNNPLHETPGERIPPGGFQQKMGDAEGQNTSVNAGGYSGRYQFGAPRLSTLGMYTPAQGENVSGGSDVWKNSPAKWQGSVHIPGFPEVKTHQDFLNNRSAQDAAFTASVADIDQAIANTPGADQWNKDGLRAVAHLGGNDGMQKFVASNGRYDPGDDPTKPGGGTHLSDYYKRFSAGGAPALVQHFGDPESHARRTAAQAAAQNPAAAAEAPAAAPATTPVSAPAAAPQAAGDEAPSPEAQAAFTAAQPPVDEFAFPPSTPSAPPPNDNSDEGDTVPLSAPAPQEATPVAAPAQAMPAGANSLLPVAGPAPTTAVAQNGLMPAGAPDTSGAPPRAVNGVVPTPNYPKTPSGGSVPFVHGVPQAVPGAPGFVRSIDPNGLPDVYQGEHAPGNIEIIKSGDQAIMFDKSRNTEVGRIKIPETGRLYKMDLKGNTYLVNSRGETVFAGAAGSRDAQLHNYDADKKDIGEIQDQTMGSQATQQRLLQMRDVASKITTGTGATGRTSVAALLKTYLPDGTISADLERRFIGGDVAAAQELGKLTTQAAGIQEQKVMGGRAGYQALRIFINNNPGLEMTPETNRRLLNAMLVSAQADVDYGRGASDWRTENRKAFDSGGNYTPLEDYTRGWLSQKNPQMYSAAINAMNGMPLADWGKGLRSDERAQVVKIVRGIDPTAHIEGVGGSTAAAPPAQAPAQAPARGEPMTEGRWNAMKSGEQFRHEDGSMRVKP